MWIIKHVMQSSHGPSENMTPERDHKSLLKAVCCSCLCHQKLKAPLVRHKGPAQSFSGHIRGQNTPAIINWSRIEQEKQAVWNVTGPAHWQCHSHASAAVWLCPWLVSLSLFLSVLLLFSLRPSHFLSSIICRGNTWAKPVPGWHRSSRDDQSSQAFMPSQTEMMLVNLHLHK